MFNVRVKVPHVVVVFTKLSYLFKGYTRLRQCFLMCLIVGFFSFSINGQSISQCCILMDVSENGEKSKGVYELWDLFIDPVNNQFNLNVSSFILMEQTQSWNLYNWNHESNKITSKGNGNYEIITNGRMSDFDMRIILSINDNGRIKDISAFLPIGTKGKTIRQFSIDNTRATINVSPLNNSAYTPE